MQILERENAILRGENGRICQKRQKKGAYTKKNPPLYGREGEGSNQDWPLETKN